MEKTHTQLQILSFALKRAPFEGWSNAMLANACKDTGFAPEEVVRFFPNGAEDALNLWFRQADQAMESTLLDSLKIREKIAALITARLQFFLPHREALRRALSYSSLHLPAGLKSLHQTVDRMWQLAGDNATDYNWYTKRFILSGVYSSTILYWLNDESDGQVATQTFLARRIENVMQIERAKQKFKQFFAA